MDTKILSKLAATTVEIYRSVSSNNTTKSFPISGSSLTSKLRIVFAQPVTFNENSVYKLELLKISFVANVKNVTASNNKIYYTKSGVNTTLTIPVGTYEFTDLFDFIKSVEPSLVFTLNLNTEKVECSLPATIALRNTVDLADSMLRNRFGMTSDNYAPSTIARSENLPIISEVSAVNIRCDKIVPSCWEQGSNGSQATLTKTMFTFYYGSLNVGETNSFDKWGSSELYFILEKTRQLNEITFSLYDQDGHELNENMELGVFARISLVRDAGDGGESF